MTPTAFQSIRKSAGLTQSELAQLLRVEDIRTIRRYEKGERSISGPVSLLMEMIGGQCPAYWGDIIASARP